MKIRIELSSLAAAETSGVGNYTRLLTNALAEHCNVYGSYFNFAMRQPKPNVIDAVQLEENQLIPLRVYAKFESYNLVWPFDFLKSHVNLTIHPNFATWPTIRSDKTATVIHDLTYLYYPELVEEKNLKHLQRVVPRTISRADYIITVSNTVKQELVKEFNLDPEKCIVTPIPPSPVFYTPSNREIHSTYSIPTKEYILFIGNLEPRKNLSTLLDAYLLLPEDVREHYSLIIGGGKGWKFEDTANKIAGAIARGENIRQIGFVDQDDLPAIYQNASVFVMPSRYEGFGMPILEALASKTPVVAADIPVLRESGGDACHYAHPDDPRDFMNKILMSLDVGYQDKLSSNHLESFSWSENAKRVINL